MSHANIVRYESDHLVFFYDDRSAKLAEIREFLASEKPDAIREAIRERAYVVLGGDGLFVEIAKDAHKDGVPILGVNFGTKGFLLHDREIFENRQLRFDEREYPMLHADIRTEDGEFRGHAFNEVYLTRAGDASCIRLSISQSGRSIERFVGDGLMVSTPAGSTGWSRSY
jgi:NAD+ kinase